MRPLLSGPRPLVHYRSQPNAKTQIKHKKQQTPLKALSVIRWLGSQVVSMPDAGTEGLGFKSQSQCCRVTVLGKLFTPIVPLFTKQQN